MLDGFRPRMFAFTTLLESQKYVYIEIKFCINAMLL